MYSRGVRKMGQAFLLTVLIWLMVGGGSGYSAVMPDWVNVSQSPFNLVEPSGVLNPVLTADDVTDVPAQFVADPFLFHEGDFWYMFFEVYNSAQDKGEIGLASSYDGLNWSYDRIVLSESKHLSYPLVIAHDGQHYMIPETNLMNEVRISRAASFLYG